MSPPELFEAQRLFETLTEVQIVAWGGYPQAERQRLAIARSDLPLDVEQVQVAALEVAGNFLFDTASHRDFLGSMLGTGLVREKTGDILVLGERGAQVLVVPELVEFFGVEPDSGAIGSCENSGHCLRRITSASSQNQANDHRGSLVTVRCDRLGRFWDVSQQNGGFD